MTRTREGLASLTQSWRSGPLYVRRISLEAGAPFVCQLRQRRWEIQDAYVGQGTEKAVQPGLMCFIITGWCG